MCGIAGIIVKQKNKFDALEKIQLLNKALQHRGPDGNGFLVVKNQEAVPYNNSNSVSASSIPYFPKENIKTISEKENIEILFAHNRLAIIDLKDTGHQPMCYDNQELWITYNGEVYNYIELKQELIQLGHRFISESDTEVVLAAYKQWDAKCVEKFNGMWAFCIYDSKKKICFASRDRLGVKPFYYINNTNLFCFASEQKAFIKAGIIEAIANKEAVSNYLINGLIETTTNNFFDGITELWPGTNLIYNLQTHEFKISEYYHLTHQVNLENNNLNKEILISEIQKLLENSIRLRLRSDVEVGTCLSGGIDSSVIAGIIAANTKKPFYTFTSVFRNNKINEEHFADLVIKKTNANSKKIEPTFKGFEKTLDELIYSQDAPIWNSSTYAQFKVMELAKENGIKVVLDGQGADELFGGYHHHFIAVWKNLFSQSKYKNAFSEIFSSDKTIPHPLLFLIKEEIKSHANLNSSNLNLILKKEFVKSNTNGIHSKNNLNEQLIDDIYNTRLKTFLKCEDRCGMWHSVESRTPFSDDVNLINFMFSFDANKKIKNGTLKYLLREASRNYLPKEIYSRYDKIGFETPMNNWMQQLKPKMLEEIKAANFDFVNYDSIHKTNSENEFQNKLLFKLFVLSRWQRVFN